jgi:hypothetical protein
VEAGYRLAYEEVVRALSQQAAALDGLRNRAGLLLSAASIVTTFLGGEVLREPGLTLSGWAAVVAFVSLAAVVMFILWPRVEHKGAGQPSALIATYLEGSPATMAETLRDLSLHLETSYRANSIVYDRMSLALRLASLLLTAEVTAWVAALAGVG